MFRNRTTKRRRRRSGGLGSGNRNARRKRSKLWQCEFRPAKHINAAGSLQPTKYFDPAGNFQSAEYFDPTRNIRTAVHRRAGSRPCRLDGRKPRWSEARGARHPERTSRGANPGDKSIAHPGCRHCSRNNSGRQHPGNDPGTAIVVTKCDAFAESDNDAAAKSDNGSECTHGVTESGPLE